MRLQITVGPRKMMITEESAVGREWRRMGRLKDKVAVAVDERAFAYGVAAPQHENKTAPLLGQRADHSISKLLPAYIAM